MTLILVSASMCVQYAMLGVEAGADDCFEKGVTVEQLIARTESGKRTELEHGAVVPTLAEIEWQYIVRTLDDVGGNRTRAAEVLGISRPKLLRAIENHGSGVMRPDVIRRRQR